MKLLFNHMIAGFFVTLFLLGIIISVVFIIYVIFDKKSEEGKPFMKLFNIKYYREITDAGNLVRRPVRIVYRYAAPPKQTIKKKSPVKKTVNRAKPAKPAKKQTPASASVSKRIYFINGKPTLERPKIKLH